MQNGAYYAGNDVNSTNNNNNYATNYDGSNNYNNYATTNDPNNNNYDTATAANNDASMVATAPIDDDDPCAYCCEYVDPVDLETQEQYALQVADYSSTDYKVARAFEYLLLIATVVELVFAVASFTFGVYLKYLREEMAVLLFADDQSTSGIIQLLSNAPALLIAAGVVTFVVAVAGSAAALRHFVPLLDIYLAFLLAITLCQLILFAAFLDNKDLIAKTVRDEFAVTGIKNYFDDADLKYVVDFIQLHFDCCGVYSYTDWTNNTYFNCSQQNPTIQRCSVPASCCANETEAALNNYCGFGALSASPKDVQLRINLDGCNRAVTEYLDSYQSVIVIIVIAIAIVPIFEEICLCIVIHYIRQERRAYEQWKATGLPQTDDQNGAVDQAPPEQPIGYAYPGNGQYDYAYNNNNNPGVEEIPWNRQ